MVTKHKKITIHYLLFFLMLSFILVFEFLIILNIGEDITNIICYVFDDSLIKIKIFIGSLNIGIFAIVIVIPIILMLLSFFSKSSERNVKLYRIINICVLIAILILLRVEGQEIVLTNEIGTNIIDILERNINEGKKIPINLEDLEFRGIDKELIKQFELIKSESPNVYKLILKYKHYECLNFEYKKNSNRFELIE